GLPTWTLTVSLPRERGTTAQPAWRARGRCCISPAMAADFLREQDAISRGLWPLAGVDEVGRGPLAGPVVAVAVILDPDAVPDGLCDSKEINAARREELYGTITASALAIGIGSVTAREIDSIN